MRENIKEEENKESAEFVIDFKKEMQHGLKQPQIRRLRNQRHFKSDEEHKPSIAAGDLI